MNKVVCMFLILVTSTVALCGCQKVKSSNAPDIMPEFIDVKEAVNIMKSIPVGTDPWQIYYANSNYVYVTYSFGSDFMFRYNVKNNSIDRALDVRCLFDKDISEPLDTHFRFSVDGTYAFFWVEIGFENVIFSEGIYKADFETQNIVLSDKIREDFNQSSDEYYKPEEYGVSADRYRAKLEKNPSLPKLYDWSTVVQIDDNVFFVIMPNEPETASPGSGYYYFGFTVIDTSQNKIIREYKFNSTE